MYHFFSDQAGRQECNSWCIVPVVSPGFELAASFSVFSPVRSELSIVLAATECARYIVTSYYRTSAGNVPLLPLNHFLARHFVCIICNSRTTYTIISIQIYYLLFFFILVKLPLLGIRAPCEFCSCCSVVTDFIWKFDSSCSNSNKGKRKKMWTF